MELAAAGNAAPAVVGSRCLIARALQNEGRSVGNASFIVNNEDAISHALRLPGAWQKAGNHRPSAAAETLTPPFHSAPVWCCCEIVSCPGASPRCACTPTGPVRCQKFLQLL